MDTNHEEHLAYEGEEGNPVYGLERRGVDYVPERERHMNLRNLAVFWIGTNLYPFNIVLGVLAYTLGLSVWLTLLTLAAGILLSYWLVGLTSIPPARAGIPTMAVSRAAFGLRFARINAALAWLVGILFEIINASIGVFAVLALVRVPRLGRLRDRGQADRTRVRLRPVRAPRVPRATARWSTSSGSSRSPSA